MAKLECFKMIFVFNVLLSLCQMKPGKLQSEVFEFILFGHQIWNVFTVQTQTDNNIFNDYINKSTTCALFHMSWSHCVVCFTNCWNLHALIIGKIFINVGKYPDVTRSNNDNSWWTHTFYGILMTLFSRINL